jgi:hypothetical protein
MPRRTPRVKWLFTGIVCFLSKICDFPDSLLGTYCFRFCGRYIMTQGNENILNTNFKQIKRVQIALIIGLLLLAVLSVLRLGHLSMSPVLGDDNAVYLTSALSLAEGNGYRLQNFPDNPPAKLYPIGYPLVLSLVISILGFGPYGLMVILILNIIYSVVGLWIVFLILCRELSSCFSALLTLFIGVNPIFFMYVCRVYSESLFFLLTVLFIYVCELPLVDRKKDLKWGLVGLLVAFLMIVRTIGFTYAVGIMLVFLVKSQWKSMLYFCLGFSFIQVPWLAWTFMNKGGTFSNYSAFGGQGFTWYTPVLNLWSVICGVIKLVFPFLETRAVDGLIQRLHLMPVFYLIGIGIGAVIIWGAWCRIRQGYVISSCLICYMAVVLLWPWEPSRFLFPVTPLLLLLLIDGGKEIVKFFPRLHLIKYRVSFILFYVGIIFSGIFVQINLVNNVWKYGSTAGTEAFSDWLGFEDACNFLKLKSENNSVVISSYPYSTYLLTGRKTLEQIVLSDLQKTNLDQIDLLIRSVPVSQPLYLFATVRKHAMTGFESGMMLVKDYEKRHPGALVKIWSSRDGGKIIYRVEKRK